MTHCDALVIGGGPAGATAAALLAQAGWSVVVIERKAFPRRKVCGEYLSATNWPLFTELGIDDAIDQQAGPEVRRVGLFVADRKLSAELPLPEEGVARWGRALSRERLDTLLLDRAAELGAEVRQPWEVASIAPDREQFICRAESVETGAMCEWQTPIVIAAHGSWEPGDLPSQTKRGKPRPGDLLGFKAHFRDASLDHDLMPLLCFPGGYGGMVHTDDGRVSLSCCIRRDRLDRLRHGDGVSAGESVQTHIEATTPIVRRVLEGATLDGRWLSAGPIRPGIRTCYSQGIFRAGNVAGEAHPAVAEGITMAMQSAWLLAERLAAHRHEIDRPTVRDEIGRDYTAAWRASFARRIRVSAAVAQWAMRPKLVEACLPLVARFPELLTWGARHSGKAELVYA
jgi:flavin-dependent dehydrogenase